jgi:lipopolysaccharide heptosyltransferase II
VTGAERWSAARRILCVRLDTLGDVLMTTPALTALRCSSAGRSITLLTSDAGSEIARLVPEIDSVITYDAPWVKSAAPAGGSDTDRAMAAQLRSQGFDAAVIFTVYSQSPLPAVMLCHFADIPLRLAHCRENPYRLLTDWVPDPEPERFVRHEVRRQLDLVAAVGCRTSDETLSLEVPDSARHTARTVMTGLGLESGATWAVVHPGASASSRRYPAEGYAAAGRRLVDSGCALVFTGAPAEVDLVEGIRSALGRPSHSLAGRLGLVELAAVIDLAPLVVTNNTGPAHIAAAVGTPVVDLYALTNPQHTPWAVASRVLSHDVPCKWCYKSVCPEGHHNCLRLVTPDEVASAALELLAEQRLRPEPDAEAGRPSAHEERKGLDRTIGPHRGPRGRAHGRVR